MTDENHLAKRKQIDSKSDLLVYVWDRQADMHIVRDHVMGEAQIVEVHVQPDGTLDKKPVVMLVYELPMAGGGAGHLYSRASLERLWPAIEEAVKASQSS